MAEIVTQICIFAFIFSVAIFMLICTLAPIIIQKGEDGYDDIDEE
jgi:hypothetical protein